ncbi:hypothetical protein BHE74_00055290, partial [Ensete ventricosum]
MPSVTCSPVEADPNPLGPGRPVISLKSPMLSSPAHHETRAAQVSQEGDRRKEGRKSLGERERERLYCCVYGQTGA